jgi:hypothetical protein
MTIMKSRGIKWASHVARKGDVRNEYRMLNGQNCGTRRTQLENVHLILKLMLKGISKKYFLMV